MGKILSSPRGLRRALMWWPPYRGAGIKVLHIADDWSSARVRLRLGRLNRNYFGTHFGGSLYSMSDPFFALLAVNRLGRDYIVWDKAGEIEYVSPGRGDVFAEFRLTEDRLEEIRKATADGEKALPWFETVVTTAEGMVVARVRKQLYVRLKRPAHG
jgi:acyl-coenzyme A thioesterase PaaI-like protein